MKTRNTVIFALLVGIIVGAIGVVGYQHVFPEADTTAWNGDTDVFRSKAMHAGDRYRLNVRQALLDTNSSVYSMAFATARNKDSGYEAYLCLDNVEKKVVNGEKKLVAHFLVTTKMVNDIRLKQYSVEIGEKVLIPQPAWTKQPPLEIFFAEYDNVGHREEAEIFFALADAKKKG